MTLLRPSFGLRVLGVGRSWPSRPAVSNEALLRLHPETCDRPPELLQQLSQRIERMYGFRDRFLTRLPGSARGDAEDSSESLALEAARAALKPGSPALAAFVLGTTTSMRYTGSTGAAVLGQLGISAPAWEVKAGCSTSLASLHLALGLLALGHSNVLVACAETLSKVIHPQVRETWFGLADGGAAIWLERAEQDATFEVQAAVYSTLGQHVDLYTTPGRLPPTAEEVARHGYALQGDSSELRELALAQYRDMVLQLLPTPEARAGVAFVVAHQVNRQLIDQVLRELGVGGELLWDAQDFGNLGGASVLFTLAHGLEQQRFCTGDTILLVSVGGGLSFAGQLWRAVGNSPRRSSFPLQKDTPPAAAS